MATPGTAAAPSAAGGGPAAGDHIGAFILRFDLAGADSGPLAGVALCVKDNFDVRGYPTGNGSPAWLESHPGPAEASAAAVEALLAGGARVVGKGHMDELAYALSGENAHYGTPANAAAPGRVPGGSTSGPAAAVAAGQADLGLGTDTGGSVRVPASYCGLWGLRSTHGRVPLRGARALAPSFSTAGLLARDARLLRRAGGALLAPYPAGAPALPGCAARSGAAAPRLLVAADAFDLALPDARAALRAALAAPAAAAALGAAPKEFDLGAGVAVGGGQTGLDAWFDVFRVLQGFEAWRGYGDWISGEGVELGPGVRERFQLASKITAAQREAALADRERVRAHLAGLLGDDGVIALPSAPGPAPERGLPGARLDDWRRRVMSLTCIAGLGGLPQVSMPLARVDGLPVGLSLIGPQGSDESLLELAERIAAGAAA
ncbi:amidase [Raphidocelis subcapitata]|uniref:Amidase n=1 Tax=Raphidocelis subcapitata TaxID=307507 RepID=A0A2V0NME7_9CHLO|nr:amidase [Raphidocelis subcapitata]|eukprot:GBF88671.1 amidase [Raphidocelis subcapitata]